MEDFLQKTYYDPAHPAAFGGVNKLLQAAKQAGFPATYGKVKAFLQTQDTYALSKPSRRARLQAYVAVAGLDAQHNIDLIDNHQYASHNDNYKYILVLEDSFSKWAYCQALYSKTGKEVAQALAQVFESRRPVYTLYGDAGGEIQNKYVKEVLAKYNITLLTSRNPQKVAEVERLIQTLRAKMERVMLKTQTHRWIDVYKDIVKGYNMSVNSSTGFKPIEVTSQNEDYVRIRKAQIRIRRRKGVVKTRPTVQTPPIKQLPAKLKPLRRNSVKTKPAKALRKPKYKVGDLVRISRQKHVYHRMYDHNWTKETFNIERIYYRNNQPVYVLKDHLSEPVIGGFSENELSPAVESDTYNVQKILKRRKRKGQKEEVFVRWWLWGKEHDSWVPASSVKDI